MTNKLVLLHKDAPVKNSYFALIRHENEGKIMYSTTFISRWDSRVILLVQATEDILVKFSNRKTELQQFHFIDKNSPLASKVKTNVENMYMSPAVIGNQPKLSVDASGHGGLREGGTNIEGWIKVASPTYFSNNEILKANSASTDIGIQSIPVLYKIELQPKTLTTFSCPITSLKFFYCNLLNSRDFSIGTALFGRNTNGRFDENGKDPDLSVYKDIPDIMLDYLESQGIKAR